MKRRLLILGEAAKEKTELIFGALGDKKRLAGGLVLRYARELEISSPAGWEREKYPDFDVAAATDCAARLNRACDAPFAVIDALGERELEDAGVYDALLRLLFTGVPCVGVINVPDVLAQRLSSDPDTTLLNIDSRYDVNTDGALRHWVDEYAHAKAGDFFFS